MAGTVTKSEKTHSSVKKVVWNWTTDASGDATKTTAAAFDGEILGFLTIPGKTTVQPSADYDVVVTDSDGHDVLSGAGADRSNTVTE